ncbi:MAG: arabinan endo-1,5-alpha-L-arabinosidase [Rikenellaceae bacterium]|nr:arabinan endo-1,5-alpha-L-arabinosidase [Rikenellaceae bacterium]
MIKKIILTTFLVIAAVLFGSAVEMPYVHDPVVAEQDGVYYMFITGRGISVMSSTDLKDWKRERPVFEEPPAWAVEAVPGYRGHTWAPDIIYRDGLYYLYYSVSAFGKNTSCIGVAVNKTLDPESPDFEWIDHGKILQSVPDRDMWNAIDPNIIVDDDGTPWMNFGSFWEGIKMVKLDSTMTSLAQPEKWYSLSRRPRKPEEADANPGSGAVEAPFIFKRGEYYYLFVSFDYCCRGAESDYKLVVGRSKDVRGPYYDRDGVDMLDGGAELVVEGNERFPGVGHNSVYTFDAKDYIFFHAYDMEENGRSRLLVRELSWDDDGWPTAEL